MSTRTFESARFEVPSDLVRDATVERLRAELMPYAETYLNGDTGYFVLSGLQSLTTDESRAFARSASAALGRLLPQDSGGTLVREVRYRGVGLGEGATGRYSDSRTGGSLHTDSPHRPGAVPDCFALLCVRQAPVGGDLLLVHLSDVLERLSARPEVLETLHRPVHFDTRDDSPGAPRTVLRPVLDSTAARTRVHYLREYIEIGHRQPGVRPLSAEQERAFDLLDSLLDSPALWTRDRLRPGEMIFIDNRRTLHGRTEFQDAPGGEGRLMLRTWISTNPS